MTKVFISHASADRRLVNGFVDLLETGIGVAGHDIFASSVEGRDIPSSSDYRSDIQKKLTKSAAAIFLLSEQFCSSPFCMAEFGLAWGSSSDIFVLLVPPLTRKKVATFFGNLQLELLNKPGSLNKLSDYLHNKLKLPSNSARWDPKRKEFLGQLPNLAKPTKARARKPTTASSLSNDSGASPAFGFWSKNIVDGTLYIGDGYPTINIGTSVLHSIEEGTVLPTVFAYMTNNGYHNWMALADDPDYVYYRDAMSLYEAHSKDLISLVKDTVGTANLDVVSLGPGNGRKDRLFLRALAQTDTVDGVYYYPYDINPSMISTSMKTVGGDTRLRGINVKAILADFESLSTFKDIYHYRPGPNLLMLLGNTLGNLPNERLFLERVYKSAMAVDDMFLLEVGNQHVEKDPEEELGNKESNKRFDFGPLEYLGVKFEPAKLNYEPDEGRSVITGTQTLVATYGGCMIAGKEYGEVALSYIHRYDPKRVAEVCERVGFRVIELFDRGSATTLLLQKPKKQRKVTGQ